LIKTSGDDTINIETYFQTVFEICISDKFLHKDQSFQDTQFHISYKYNSEMLNLFLQTNKIQEHLKLSELNECIS
jgi:hypothetical protein